MRSAAVLTGLALALAGVATETALGDIVPPVPTLPTPTVPTPTVTTPVPVPTLPTPTVPAATTPSAPSAPVHVTTPSVGVSSPSAQQPVPSVSVSGGTSVGTSGTSGSGGLGGVGASGSSGGSGGAAGGGGAGGGGSSSGGGNSGAGSGYGAAQGGAASRAGARGPITRLRVSRPWLSTTGPGAQRKTVLNFRLRTRARVVFTVTQVAPECRPVGHFGFRGRPGLNKVAFSGRFDGRELTPGTYRISARVAGGAALLRVIVVIVDAPPSPTELEQARQADVCAASRVLASNATLASGGAAGSTGSGASQPSGAASEIVRNQAVEASAPTSSGDSSSSAKGGHATAAPFSPERVSGNATSPLVILPLALALVLLGLAALPQHAIPDPRINEVLARHRLEVAFAGAGALAAAVVALALA